MKRKLNIDQELSSFEGKPLKINIDDNERSFTLKDGILTYLRNSYRMNLSDHEQNAAYVLGILVGKSSGEVELTTEQYDVLKKLSDYGKSKDSASGKEQEMWNTIEIKIQIKDMVDSAEQVKEPDDKPKQ